MTCRRCGEATPRLTIAQRYCKQCAREVAAIVSLDERRRTRFSFAKELQS